MWIALILLALATAFGFFCTYVSFRFFLRKMVEQQVLFENIAKSLKRREEKRGVRM